LWWRRRSTPAADLLKLAPPTAPAGKLPPPAKKATEEAQAAFRRAMSRQ